MRKSATFVTVLALAFVASLALVATRFSLSDTLKVVRYDDGKSVEVCGWTQDVGQKRVMDILLRRSKGRPWRATKLDYPDTEMVWRYTQPETKMHAAYERRNTDDLNCAYYDLTVFPSPALPRPNHALHRQRLAVGICSVIYSLRGRPLSLSLEALGS